MMKVDYEALRDKVHDVNGRKVTLSLFTEFQRTEYPPIWSLIKDWKPIFLSARDPTEYAVAMATIGDWEHYTLIRNTPKIKAIMDTWATEVEVGLRADAVKAMIKHSQKENGTAAAKWIAEGGFTDRVLKNKAAREEEQKIKSAISDRVAADAERLGLKVVMGGK